MKKTKLKFLITTFTLFLLLFSSFSFATDSNDTFIDDTEDVESEIRNSDLYINNEDEFDISDTINGNVFASVDTLNISPSNNGGIIEGNLFATASTVNIKSDVTYSDTAKDEIGNPAISIDNYCTISGNAFIVANKFVLESGCKIYGDLYVVANEIELSQSSTIYGNVFIISNKLTLNAEIGGSLYATVNSIDMQYFGFISRDLHLIAETADLNGYVYRNSFITAKNITTYDEFINQKDFNVNDADNLVFSGQVKGNATINSKNITLKDKDDDENSLICIISGDLSYSSKQEIEIPDGIVSGEIGYSNYVNTSSKSAVWAYILNLLATLVCVYIIYILTLKFAPKCLDKISKITGLSLLKYFGIGLGFLIIIPIISILLFMIRIGSLLGLILLLIYIILLLIAKPVFIISIATFAKNKISNKINAYLYILGITIILSLIALIPYVGFVISILIKLIGLGIMIKHLIPKKKKKKKK